ncbi:Peptidoglycan/LPS O-acetylase OafA/YrhL, contains acyltransferase and SGNH-hydrolase domains [Burkholderia sp. GAS332]|nr:Peptidoglycan/LPS O-acetylase OafA/YrhL, contains acyltransferase and SGNH-hydrolase domains [Burkholderia sp. GAS332]
MYATDIRFNHVQALRFFAAAAVVLGHSVIFWHMKFPGTIDDATRDYFGWAGGWSVGLFFCISGFVITHSSRNQSPLAFLAIRMLRIYPAFWFACLLAAAIKLFFFHSFNWHAEGFTWQSLLLVPAGEIPYPLRVEWSLVHEVFFYILFFVFLAVPGRRKILEFSLLWLAIILGAQVLGHGYTDRYPVLTGIFVSSRNLPFIGGVIIYFYAQSSFVRRWHKFFPIWALGTALLAQVTNSTFLILVTQAISSMLVLAYAIERDHVKPLSADSVVVKFGDASYGLYLFHITAITVLLALWNGSHSWIVTIVSVVIFGLSLGLMFGVAEQRLYRGMKKRLEQLLRRSRPLNQSTQPVSSNN